MSPYTNMRSGLLPVTKDRRDLDFFATRPHALGAVIPLQYSVDAGLRVPNQTVEDTNFTPPVPPLPEGCTDYAQSEILADEDGHLFNPMDIENITHANARGGGDIRAALRAAIQLHPEHPAYFNVSPAGPLDYFDAVHLAMLATSNEKRGVSVGSPFWHEWLEVGANGVLPLPQYSLGNASWHNWVVKGWDQFAGVDYLTCQMLQGASFGNHGLVFITRDQFNATMAVSGSAMFTLSKLLPGEKPQTIGSPILQEIINFIESIWH